MGFPDLTQDSGIQALDGWMATRSYVELYSPSQADVACFKAIKSGPKASEHPHASRWYNHIASYEAEFASLPGDATKSFAEYGPTAGEAAASAKAAAAADDDDDDDVNLFDSDEEEDVEAAQIREQRLKDYKERKAAKPKTIAKSVVILDVKPWDDETNMIELEAAVRGIDRDGLVWGASKLIPVGFGIKKLQINVVVEDDKISTQDLQDEIESFEDYVQSSDIASFQKL